jgi:hypothetical protein
MKNGNQIMDVELPTPEAAELTTKAAQAGIPTSEYLGIQVLTAAYGVFHPEVVAFRNRSKTGINGPETPEES